MYSFEIKEELEKSLQKLVQKDKRHYQSVVKKILQIADNPEKGKPLRNVLKGRRRVHVGHFVLIYEVDEKNKRVIFLDFEHHDRAYK
ncbi:MAG: type II toxin-antitoxin system RelE/ParE family toxin [Nitrospirae bacterium]|nr:type II toxin-antitoxin system RelE/ParE family toxin [Nitrospirota bacterium]